jgi:hypothetical protein
MRLRVGVCREIRVWEGVRVREAGHELRTMSMRSVSLMRPAENAPAGWGLQRDQGLGGRPGQGGLAGVAHDVHALGLVPKAGGEGARGDTRFAGGLGGPRARHELRTIAMKSLCLDLHRRITKGGRGSVLGAPPMASPLQLRPKHPVGPSSPGFQCQ